MSMNDHTKIRSTQHPTLGSSLRNYVKSILITFPPTEITKGVLSSLADTVTQVVFLTTGMYIDSSGSASSRLKLRLMKVWFTASILLVKIS